ncbi:MAG: DUF2892 domain-containing protein [Bdellovibrionaceae bacterium]|nr:DUF2892 domain-containing protein [Pseudobdellovibrionaceae bacterium]
MKINLALWDRILRYLLGVVLSTWAVAGGPWWCFFGLYLLITAAWGLCPLYGLMKFRTYHDKFQLKRRETL